MTVPYGVLNRFGPNMCRTFARAGAARVWIMPIIPAASQGGGPRPKASADAEAVPQHQEDGACRVLNR